MKNAKKHLALLLAILTLSTMSCGGKTAIADETTPESDETTGKIATTDQYGRTIIPHEIPSDLTFDGVELNCLVRETPQYSIDFGVDASNGDVVNDAVYNRNIKVEEALKVNLNVIRTAGSNTMTSEAVGDLLRQSVMAGDASYDICGFYQFYGAGLALDGLLMNVNEMKYLDFSKPWWNQDFVGELTYKNQLYYMVGSMNLSRISSLTGVFFNQAKIVDYHKNYEFLYDDVYAGKWTLDRFSELVKDVYADLNGSGKADEGDFFGLSIVEDNQGAWRSALGIKLCSKDNNGVPQLSFYNERTATAYEKLYTLFKSTNGVYFGSKKFDSALAFANGQCLFIIRELNITETHLRDMKDGYGLLPMPKYDETQEGYYNGEVEEANLIGIASNCDKVEAACAALELLNYYSYLDVIPAYYEVAMKSKYLADSDSANMFDLILGDVKVDFGEVYTLTISGGEYTMEGAFSVQLRNLIRLGREEIGSNYAKYENIYKAGLAEVLEKYDELAK